MLQNSTVHHYLLALQEQRQYMLVPAFRPSGLLKQFEILPKHSQFRALVGEA